ncbi:MAG: hypothetical protein QOJ15_3438, partial [Bradyrhizobium sp.]|nr:hypothetical protein [Bradyrhizobium sp.]
MRNSFTAKLIPTMVLLVLVGGPAAMAQ